MPTAAVARPRHFLGTSGRRPRRTDLAEKIRILSHGASPQATADRLEEYRRLFAYRYLDGIVTRTGQGPRAWTRLPKRLGTKQIVRHLLGNRIPGLEPVWFGARSMQFSRWFAIDIDADRTPEQLLEADYDLTHADDEMKAHILANLRRSCKPKPPFTERLVLVERALRRMGIDPSDRRKVLSLPTPSGGRHLYVFLDGQYHLEMIYDLLESAGLKHTPGEVEFFPAVNRALRLPFGFIPGQAFDPNAWIQFIDDYHNGRTRRFSLASLRTHLEQHQDRWSRQNRSVENKQRLQTHLGTVIPVLGVPKASRYVHDLRPQGKNSGIHAFSDAEELLARGIEAEGTRNMILNQLAAHFIWFRHLSAEEAAATLTTWAMNPRHRSKDIAADLDKGLRTVAAQIVRMCDWYEAKKQTVAWSKSASSIAKFAPTEIESLRLSLNNLAPDRRRQQAEFLLHFLAFAKRHGKPTDDGSAWIAAAAINAVVKKWPGCHHMNYKLRIDHAIAAGVLILTKEKWQNPHGKGRARTYQLQVPVVPEGEASLDYESAMTQLLQEQGLDESVEEKPGLSDETPITEENGAEINHGLARPVHPTAVPEESSDSGLGTGPRQCNSERNATERLPDFRSRLDGADHGQSGRSTIATAKRPVFAHHERQHLRLFQGRPNSCPAPVIPSTGQHRIRRPTRDQLRTRSAGEFLADQPGSEGTPICRPRNPPETGDHR